MQLLAHTQEAYVLSLNIITHDHSGYALTPIPLVRLTGLIFLVWSILQTATRLWLTLNTLTLIVIQAALDFCEAFYLLVNTLGGKPWQKTLAGNYGG